MYISLMAEYETVIRNRRKFDPHANAIESSMLSPNQKLLEQPTIRQRVNAIEAEMKKQPH